MNIGEAARASGVSAKMIRYYEQISLVRAADRTDGNYRSFSDRDVNDLKFIRRARSLGFSVADITNLLSLWRDRERPSRDVKTIADRHVADLEVRMSEIQAMADTLKTLTDGCAGDDRPDCPILNDLAAGPVPARVSSPSPRRGGLRP